MLLSQLSFARWPYLDSFTTWGSVLTTWMVARKLLEDNRDKVEAMTHALLEWETIDSEQIDDIMAGKPPRPPKPSQSTSRPSAPSDSPGAEPSAPATACSPHRKRLSRRTRARANMLFGNHRPHRGANAPCPLRA